MVPDGKLPGKALVGTARLLGVCISDQCKKRYDLWVNIFFRHKIIRPKQNSSKKYNLEILSFVNSNKNRPEYLSFEKLQYDFGTEIGPKIAFNTIYEKPWLLRFLTITFLIEASLPLGLRTGNMVQKWAKFLCYIFYSFS